MTGAFIDLHTHSVFSDGSDTPTELIHKAAAEKVRTLALTDHDTTDGLDEAETAAKEHGITFIRGCEIALQDTNDQELHMLGLWLPAHSERMQRALAIMREGRENRNGEILDILRKKGMPISFEEMDALSPGGAIGRPHIAIRLKKKGYVKSIQEAFVKLLGINGQAYVPRVLPSQEEGITLLHEEGAIVSFAHPCLQKTMPPERLNTLLDRFKAWGLTAIEAYHSSHDAQKTRVCLKMAKRHNLLVTGGSDYHGTNKSNVLLARIHGGQRVPVTVIEKLQEYRKAHGQSE